MPIHHTISINLTIAMVHQLNFAIRLYNDTGWVTVSISILNR